MRSYTGLASDEWHAQQEEWAEADAERVKRERFEEPLDEIDRLRSDVARLVRDLDFANGRVTQWERRFWIARGALLDAIEQASKPSHNRNATEDALRDALRTIDEGWE